MNKRSYKQVLLALPLVAAFATESFGETTYIKNIVGVRTDLANYCTDGVSENLLWFQDSTGPFYASRDLTVGGLYDYSTSATLEMEPDRVITLNGHMYTRTGPFDCKGGIYDFQNTYGFNTGEWNGNVQRGCGMYLDGTVFTNMPSVCLQRNGKDGGKWTMKNGARMHVAGLFRMGYYDSPNTGLTFDMQSGAQVTCKQFETDGGSGGYGSSPRAFVLSGEGTKLIVTGSGEKGEETSIGRGYSDAEVRLSDHAEWTNGGTIFIGKEWYTYRNALRLSSSAKATLGVVYLGCNGGGTNVIEVADDAVLTMGDCYLNGGNSSTKGNTFIVSNATVSASTLHCSSVKGSDTTIRISGDHPKVRVDGGTRLYGNAFEMNNGVKMIFDIPPTGYVDDQIPIDVKGWSTEGGKYTENPHPVGTYVNDPTKLTIELNGVAEFQEWLEKTDIRRKKLVLLHVAGGISGYDKAIEAVNATLPDKCKLYITAGTKVGLASGSVIVLQVGTHRGLTIGVR